MSLKPYLQAFIGQLRDGLVKRLGNERGAEVIEVALWIAVITALVLIAKNYGTQIVTSVWSKASSEAGK